MLKSLTAKAAEILPSGSEMSLFGSRARGDAKAESDWDIHVLIPGEEKVPLATISRYADALSDVGWDYGEMVNVVLYSYLGWSKRSFLPFYKNVEGEKIVLFRN